MARNTPSSAWMTLDKHGPLTLDAFRNMAEMGRDRAGALLDALVKVGYAERIEEPPPCVYRALPRPESARDRANGYRLAMRLFKEARPPGNARAYEEHRNRADAILGRYES